MGKKMRSYVVFICFAIMMFFVGGVFQAEPANAADGMTRAEWIHGLTGCSYRGCQR